MAIQSVIYGVFLVILGHVFYHLIVHYRDYQASSLIGTCHQRLLAVKDGDSLWFFQVQMAVGLMFSHPSVKSVLNQRKECVAIGWRRALLYKTTTISGEIHIWNLRRLFHVQRTPKLTLWSMSCTMLGANITGWGCFIIHL